MFIMTTFQPRHPRTEDKMKDKINTKTALTKSQSKNNY